MKTTNSTNLIACVAIAGALTAGFASGAATAQSDSARIDANFEFPFTYAADELTSIDQANSLLSRLERKVRRHCDDSRRMSLEERRLVEACVAKTMEDSIQKFGSSSLAQIYANRADG